MDGVKGVALVLWAEPIRCASFFFKKKEKYIKYF